MISNIDIFITAFRPFNEYVNDERYKVVGVKGFIYNGELKSFNDDVGDNISKMNQFFNELTVFYWVWKNYPMKEYVGMCSYRRYFSFFDDIDSIENDLKEYEIIVPNKLSLGKQTVIEQYKKCHNINDLMLVINIIKQLYPDYTDTINEFINNNWIYSNNIFILNKDEYIKYCSFLFRVLYEYLTLINVKTISELTIYVENNEKNYASNKLNSLNKIEYQCRIGGFLAERIFTIYVLKNFKKIKEIPIVYTEKRKYVIRNKK